MPEQGSKIHPEYIIHLINPPDTPDPCTCQHDNPRQDVGEVHAGKNVNKRLGCIVVNENNSPIRQNTPSIYLDDKKSDAQQERGHKQ